MLKYILHIILICMAFGTRAQKLYGGSFERKATQTLSGQEFSYNFGCTFYADEAGKNALPDQLKFRIFRKRDNAFIREFMASKNSNPDKNTIYNECVSNGASPSINIFSVLYNYEAIIHPGEFNDSEGYYVVNEAPNVPRAPTANVQSKNLVLYHWFSPEYLFTRLDNADQGRALTGIEGNYVFMCRNEGKSLRMQLNAFPTIKFFDPVALDVTARTSKPLTDGAFPFKEAVWTQGYNGSQPNGDALIISDSKPKFDNNSETTFFEAWTVPPQNGVYSLSFVTEQRRYNTKLSENTLEIYTEVNDCKKISYVTLNITEAGSNKTGNASFCKDKPISINANTIQDGLEFQWYKNQQPIEGANSNQLRVLESGQYYLKTKKEGTCGESNTMIINAVAINCHATGPPSILGANLHDMISSSGPTPNGFINKHAFRAIYYTPVTDIAKMPSALKAGIYRKRDNQKIDDLVLSRNTFAEQTHLLERLCDSGLDSIQQIAYDLNFDFDPNRYNDSQGYFITSEAVCCRADVDNLVKNGNSVVTYMEIGPANQVKTHQSILRGHTVDLSIPFTIKTCVGQPVRVFLYAGNRENVTAQFGGFAEIIDGQNSMPSGRSMTWAQGFSADNFNGNLKKMTVEPRRNGQMILTGVPEKPGIFVYRLRIDGIMDGKIYSSVFQEFRLEVDDCTPPPQPQIFVSKVGKPTVAASPELCQDSLVQLNLRNFRSWAKLQWFSEKRILFNATDSILIVPKNQSASYTCSIKMPRQCPEIIVTNPQKITFLPKPTATISAPSSMICEGQAQTLLAGSNTEIKSTQWLFDNQLEAGATKTNLVVSKAGAYSVSVTDAKGCSNKSLPYNIIVNQLPNVEIKAPQDYFCEGQSLTLTAQSVAKSAKFQWQLDNKMSNNEVNANILAKNVGNYSVQVTDNNGCMNVSKPFLVKTVSLPKTEITAPRNIVCRGESMTLKATLEAGNSYEWLKDNVALNNQNSTLSVGETGNYAVKITSSFNCVNLSKPVYVEQVKNPTVLISAPLTRICQGVLLDITASGQFLKTYQWQKDGKAVSGSNEIKFAVKQSGSYSVMVVDSNDCKNTSSSLSINVVVPIEIKLDSIPDFCGFAFEPVRMNASPTGGMFSGKGVQDNYFSPRAAGLGKHNIKYTVRGDLECLSGAVEQTVHVKAAPQLSLGPAREIWRGTSTRLNADMGQGYTYTWTPTSWISDIKGPKPLVDPDNTTFYKVLATSPDNCKSEDSVKIVVIQRVFMPDVFTPNGDGQNDTWRIVGMEEYPDIEIKVFNRWGNLVYYAKGNNSTPFDGTFRGESLPEGVYTYVVQAKPDGHIDRGAVMISR